MTSVKLYFRGDGTGTYLFDFERDGRRARASLNGSRRKLPQEKVLRRVCTLLVLERLKLNDPCYEKVFVTDEKGFKDAYKIYNALNHANGWENIWFGEKEYGRRMFSYSDGMIYPDVEGSQIEVFHDTLPISDEPEALAALVTDLAELCDLGRYITPTQPVPRAESTAFTGLEDLNAFGIITKPQMKELERSCDTIWIWTVDFEFDLADKEYGKDVIFPNIESGKEYSYFFPSQSRVNAERTFKRLGRYATKPNQVTFREICESSRFRELRDHEIVVLDPGTSKQMVILVDAAGAYAAGKGLDGVIDIKVEDANRRKKVVDTLTTLRGEVNPSHSAK